MTAIVGFTCRDGLVIASDTEESYGEVKAYTHKLFPSERPRARLCIAGAGIGYLIDYVNERVVDALDSRITTVSAFRASLVEILEKLYENKFHHYPVESEAELRIQLLIGVQFASDATPPVWTHPALFECQASLVTPIGRTKRSCILGVGEVLKQTGIEFAGWGLTVSLAEWASIYLIHEAKRRLGGVGGNTHTFVMRTDGTFSYGLGKNIMEKEALLQAFARTNQLFMLSLDPSVPDSRAKDFVDAGVKWLRDARRVMQKLEREGSKVKPPIEIRSGEIEKIMRKIARRSASQRSEPGQ
jgi:hypothetical protein